MMEVDRGVMNTVIGVIGRKGCKDCVQTIWESGTRDAQRGNLLRFCTEGRQECTVAAQGEWGMRRLSEGCF